MKKILLSTLVILSIIVFQTGCGKDETTVEQIPKIVKTQAVSSQNVTSGYSYLGIVKAKETKNYSFLTAGKISEICVEKGQQFKKGDILAKLDTTSMQYQASIGQNTRAQAEATLQKTISTYDTNISNAKSQIETLDKAIEAGEKGIEALETGLVAEEQNISAGEGALNTLKGELDAAIEINKAGGLSDKDLEQIQSTYNTKSAELEGARATYKGNQATLVSKKAELEATKAKKKEAETSLDNLYTSKSKDVAAAQATVKSAGTSNDIVNKNINDCVLKADSDGYVMELPFKEGEVISAGYPVVVSKSKELVVTIGASDSEYKSMAVGGKALINGKAVGVIETIAQYPDEKTRTYAVDIAVTGDYTIGETVNVKVITGSVSGLYIPIDAIFNSDGVDYVYAVNSDNRVYKKQVVLGGFEGDKVEVQIDDPYAIVVTEGIKSLRENDLVSMEG